MKSLSYGHYITALSSEIISGFWEYLNKKSSQDYLMSWKLVQSTAYRKELIYRYFSIKPSKTA